MNNTKTVSELSTCIESMNCVEIKKPKNGLLKVDRSVLSASIKDPSNEKLNEAQNKSYRKTFYSNVLTKEELNNFRTVLCNDHLNSSCLDPEKCFNSHCTAWQRRNPTKYKYSSTICPDIDFSRKGTKGRMSLNCRCRKGKFCEYAHTKEEELYHPDAYKTKKCNVFPNCKRFFCPFIHDHEMDFFNSLEELEITHKIPKIEKSEDEQTRVMGIFRPDFQHEVSQIHEVDIGKLKQELLLKIINCQKMVLEEKYSSAQNMAEDINNTIVFFCKSYFPSNTITKGSNSNLTDSQHEYAHLEKTPAHLNNHMKDVFNFSFDFKNCLKNEEFKKNNLLGDIFTY